jgi:hypothetical protein
VRALLVLLIVTCGVAGSVEPASAGNAKRWCAAVIQVNTKYGTMRHKRYFLPSQVSPSAWRHVVEATLAGRRRYISLAPSSIKTAVKHQVAWYVKVRATTTRGRTPYSPLTFADIRDLTNFQVTECGITFAGDWPLPPS